MGFYFRRSRKILPGVRMNLSKNGVGFSFGTRGARYSISPTGRRTASIGIPGTGLSYRSYSGATKQVPRTSTKASSTNRVGSKPQTHHGSPSSVLRVIAWCVLLALGAWVVADFFAPLSKLGKDLNIVIFVLIVACAVPLYFTKPAKQSQKEKALEDESESLEALKKDLAQSIDIQGKIELVRNKRYPVDADFGLALEDDEVGFYKEGATYFDPKKPDALDDSGTAWVTSERIVFGSIETTKEWKFSNITQIIELTDSAFKVFAVTNRQRNTGIHVDGDVADFDNYLHSALAVFNPRFSNVDLDKVIAENIADLQRQIASKESAQPSA